MTESSETDSSASAYRWLWLALVQVEHSFARHRVRQGRTKFCDNPPSSPFVQVQVKIRNSWSSQMQISLRSVATTLLLASRAVPANALLNALFASLCSIPLLSFFLQLFGLCQDDAGSPLERSNEIPNFSRSEVNFDGDRYNDIIAGTKNSSGCGEVHFWLSRTFCPTTGEICDTELVDERPNGGKDFPDPSVILTTKECDPLFGSYMVALDESDELFIPSGEGREGWLLDVNTVLAGSGPLDIGSLATKVETSPLLLPAVQAAREAASGSSQCEPCCGPSYCCCTAGNGWKGEDLVFGSDASDNLF